MVELPWTSSALREFNDRGYTVVRGLLDIERDICPVIDEYNQLLHDLTDLWIMEGHLSEPHAQCNFSDRLIRVIGESRQPYDLHFDISLPQSDITEETPIHLGPAVFALLRSPRLLDAVEQFIGPEIYSNPVQHTRVKLPEHRLPDESRTGLTAQIAWHQDLGVITPDADATEMLTVWFPITSATIENGCLAVVPGSHRTELELHCRSRNPLTQHQVCIPERLLDTQGVAVPMEPGDVLFMHRKTKHCGLPNRSEQIRWSFDLRYQPIGQPTGRRWFPGFIARSKSDPQTELTDHTVWRDSWLQARRELSQSDSVLFNRWKQADPRCA